MQYSILFFVLPSEIFCNHASSSRYLAPSHANLLSNYRFHWVPMCRSIRFSFFLVEVTTYLRNRFGDWQRQSFSIFRICMDNDPFFVILRNVSSCEEGWLVWSKVDQTCTCFQRACICPNFLEASGHFFFWFLKNFEQFFAGPGVCVVNMNLVHKSLSFSRYHDIWRVFWVEIDWAATSIPYSSRIFTIWTSMTGPITVWRPIAHNA